MPKCQASTQHEELRHILELSKNYKYKDIRVRVIEPAVKELIQKNGWIIDWKALKNGRLVESIRLTYRRDNQQNLLNKLSEKW